MADGGNNDRGKKGRADGAPLNFANRKELEAWLETQPKEVAVVIAARAALRVAPLLGRLFLHQHRLRKTSTFILSLFRAMLVSRSAAGRSAISAYFDSFDLAYISDVAPDLYAACAAAIFMAKTADAIDASDAAGFAASAAFTYAGESIDRALEETLSRAVLADADALRWGKYTPQTLADVPLWHGNAPDWAFDRWLDFKNGLLALDEDWEVWTSWYEDRLAGRPSIEELEIARLMLGFDDADEAEKVWEQGPKVVNARIKELIAAYWAGQGDKEAPREPAQTAGPSFAIPDGRLDHIPGVPGVAETEDAGQRKLFAHLKKRHQLLADAMAIVCNQYPILAASVSDYGEYLDVGSIEELDVDALWMTGAGLIEQARGFRDQNSDHTLTPPLEPQIDGLLQECARLHAGLIMGFEKGRAMAERSDFPLLDRAAIAELLDQQRAIVGALLATGNALADRARRLLEALGREIHEAAVKLENAAKIGYPVVRNALIAIGVFARRAVIGTALASALVNLGGMGEAWVLFLQANAGPVLGFANNFPELREYFHWLMARLAHLNGSQEPK